MPARLDWDECPWAILVPAAKFDGRDEERSAHSTLIHGAEGEE